MKLSRLIKCKNCGHEIGIDSNACPRCGSWNWSWINVTGVIIIVLLILFVVWVLF